MGRTARAHRSRLELRGAVHGGLGLEDLILGGCARCSGTGQGGTEKGEAWVAWRRRCIAQARARQGAGRRRVTSPGEGFVGADEGRGAAALALSPTEMMEGERERVSGRERENKRERELSKDFFFRKSDGVGGE